MNKKLLIQIRNEWRTNLWLFVELFLVSVVMWFIVDYLYVQYSVYHEPRGFDISHCYLIETGYLTSKSSDFNPADTLVADDIEELMERLRHRPEIEAVSLSHNSFPYNDSNSGCIIQHDTLNSLTCNNYVVQRLVTPDFLRVFRYRGVHGETAEQLADMLTETTFLASDNIFELRYGIKMRNLVGKSFYLYGDTTKTFKLAASLQPIRYADFLSIYDSYTVIGLLPRSSYSVGKELCVRVKADQDVNFPSRLKADSEKQYRIGNVFISEVRSFENIRRNFQQSQMNNLRNYLAGMFFLMLNIFLGLLGTFWFRTQQRRAEIALQMALGSTSGDIFGRLLLEAILLLTFATILAVVVDYNLARAELNAWYNGTTLSAGRFIITVVTSWGVIALMILLGIWFPARKAMAVQPAEALHED